MSSEFSTQVAVQFPSQAYQFVYIISKSPKPGAGQLVSGDHLFKSSVIKTWSRVFIGQQILLTTPRFLFYRRISGSRARALTPGILRPGVYFGLVHRV